MPSGPWVVSSERLGWQNGEVTKSTAEDELAAEEVSQADEDALIWKLATGRREGRDTSQEAKALMSIAAKKNRAALDRLAK